MENHKKRRPLYIVLLLVLGFGVYLAVSLYVGPNQGLINTRTYDCKKGLEEALNTLEKKLNTENKIREKDIQMLVDKGNLDRTFQKGSIKTTYSYRIINEKGACQLRAWKMVFRKPGEIAQNARNYGTVEVNNCACQ